jgi:hypothetical protein
MIIVNVHGETARIVESGEGVFLCAIIYDIKSEALVYAFPETFDKNEGAAILEKFGVPVRGQT